MTEQAPILKEESGPVSNSAQYHCHASRNAAATFVGGAAISWDVIVEDSSSMFNSGTPPVTTVTIPVDGIYIVSCGFYDTTGGNAAIYLKHNGNYTNNVLGGGESSNFSLDTSRTFQHVRRYSAGDTLLVEVAGGSLDVLASRRELYWFTTTKIA